jgi:polyisoprenoid-binding protein YceI
MSKQFLLAFLLFATLKAGAQNKFFTKKGKITFDATTPTSPEKIRGKNENVVCVIDLSSGAMEFMLSMTAFDFEKALMGEHFNENYVESEKYPKANFKGSITDIKSVSLSKDGNQAVTVKGNLTLHGVTREVQAPGILTIQNHTLTGAKSELLISLSDFKIEVPSLVSDKLAKEAKVKVEVNLDPVK